jgi:GntR family transcriptional regulator/MocR family aminotransferase
MGVISNPMANHQTNLAWDNLLDLDDPEGGEAGRRSAPMHARLRAGLKSAIRAGRIPVGAALPPSREMAAELGCSRWVVTEAYEQLVAEGYLESRVGSGTRVRAVERATAGAVDRGSAVADGLPEVGAVAAAGGDPDWIDLAPGLPDLRQFPVAAWLGALRSAALSLPYPELSYPDPAGHPKLRGVLADYLGRVRGASATAADVTITSGVTDGVTRICRALRARGVEAVAVEDPGWGRLRSAAAVAGLATVPIPVDGEGLVVESLVGERPGERPEVRFGEGPRVGAVIVSPAHQFPTGSVLAPARRADLLEWARRADGLIVEDDYDAEFRYDRRPVATLQGADPSRVALLGSLSKTLSPALGIGWMITPAWLTAAVRGIEVRPAAPPLLDQLAFAELLSSGAYDRHMRAARKRYRARRDRLVAALAESLPGMHVSGAAAGLHLLLHSDEAPAGPAGPAGPAVVEQAERLGLHIASLHAYRVRNGAAGRGLVLGYGNLGDGEVDRAVARLVAALAALTATGPEPRSAAMGPRYTATGPTAAG